MANTSGIQHPTRTESALATNDDTSLINDTSKRYILSSTAVVCGIDEVLFRTATWTGRRSRALRPSLPSSRRRSGAFRSSAAGHAHTYPAVCLVGDRRTCGLGRCGGADSGGGKTVHRRLGRVVGHSIPETRTRLLRQYRTSYPPHACLEPSRRWYCTAMRRSADADRAARPGSRASAEEREEQLLS